ncbi:MAG: hypothetical protein ABF489_09250, partial [Bifidobacterium sp.]|uniref:hypothetical protein n=1 Tax=Bifidobacterium sp. TaxID=41200 RepID=UPI0039E8C111
LESRSHIAAHAAETDHADLHDFTFHLMFICSESDVSAKPVSFVEPASSETVLGCVVLIARPKVTRAG